MLFYFDEEYTRKKVMIINWTLSLIYFTQITMFVELMIEVDIELYAR